MTCDKCGYRDKKETSVFGYKLCSFCSFFAPSNKRQLEKYVREKVDWRVLESFRNLGVVPGVRQKEGMALKADSGMLVTRAPLGYDVVEGRLIPNEDSVRVHSLFRNFLNKELSLNVISKEYGLSVNGLKKVLKNRTYLGEIKFDGKIHKGNHKSIISPEIFYAVQRKLEGYLKPRKRHPEKYNVLKGETEPLNDENERGVKEEIYKLENKGLYRSVFD